MCVCVRGLACRSVNTAHLLLGSDDTKGVMKVENANWSCKQRAVSQNRCETKSSGTTNTCSAYLQTMRHCRHGIAGWELHRGICSCRQR